MTVWRFVEERFTPPSREKGSPEGGFWHGLRLVVRSRDLLSVFSVRIIVRLGMRMLGPILPLFIQSLVPPTARVASITGLVSGAGAASSAVG
ncbi:MAG: hypothetical protein P8129_19530, partial [Anaerolineae bacterium]